MRNACPVLAAPNTDPVVFVDGPNIDMVLGDSIIRRKPSPHERPRWERVRQYCVDEFRCTRREFVLNGNRFDNDAAFKFYRKLHELGWSPACPKHDAEDPVDWYIRRQLRKHAASRSRSAVVLIAHDHGYAKYLEAILDYGGAVVVIGFREWLAPELSDLQQVGAEFLDLEYDLGAFNVASRRQYHPNWE
jgi:uncharacterized protein